VSHVPPRPYIGSHCLEICWCPQMHPDLAVWNFFLFLTL
jgi:hypothetical protein